MFLHAQCLRIWLSKLALQLPQSDGRAHETCFTFIRAKHPMKVYVWAGNGLREATEICIFNGTMDTDLYCEIIQETLPVKYG